MLNTILRTVMGFDWKKSEAHLLLLSKFVHAQSPDDFSKTDDWKKALGEMPKQAIKRFFNEGILIVANLNSLLSYKYKVSDLKEMLKQRGLPLSGRKDEMIQRLIQTDPDGMKKSTDGLSIFECSPLGLSIAEQYLTTEKEKRIKVEQQVMEYIKKRNFREASLAVANYEEEQVFPRDIGINWKYYNPNGDIEMLNTIFSSKPKILATLDNEKLESLQLGAAMMGLWGIWGKKNMAKKWLPENFETGLAFDNDAALRIFFFYTSYHISLEGYRESGVVEYVEILAMHDSCDACKKLTNKKYKLDAVPELPHEHCTHEMGCRCTLIPAVDL
jgi:hypothetical protein